MQQVVSSFTQWPKLRPISGLACALLAGTACSAASGAGAAWQAGWSHRVDRAGEADRSSTADREARANTLFLERQTRGSAFGARHRYDIVPLPAVDGVAAATNGHLHRLAGTARWTSESSSLRLEPTLAVSSNVGKHPKSLTGSDLQPDGAWEFRAAGGQVQSIWVGVQADARLGRWRAYPTLHWRGTTPAGSAIAPSSRWQLGFPDSHWHRRLAADWTLQLGIAPDGGQWQVRDRELVSRSRVRVASWRASAALEWAPLERVGLALMAGRAFAGEARYTLLDGRAVRADLADATFVGASVTARFR